MTDAPAHNKRPGGKSPGAVNVSSLKIVSPIIRRLETALDCSTRFVVAAAVAHFNTLPTAEQLDLVNKARVANADALKAGGGS